MIDYDKEDQDPTVAEVRRAREEYSAQFNHDLAAIFADLQPRADQAARAGETVVSRPPRRPPNWTDPANNLG